MLIRHWQAFSSGVGGALKALVMELPSKSSPLSLST